MNQLALFDCPAPAVLIPALPEAITNDSGVMIGNVYTRTYGGRVTRGRFVYGDMVLITIGQIDGVHAYSLSINAGSSGRHFAPSLKWKGFNAPDMASAIENAERYARSELGKIIACDWDKGSGKAAKRLLDMIDAQEFTESNA